MKNMELSEMQEKKIERKKRFKNWVIIIPVLFLALPLVIILTFIISGSNPTNVVKANVSSAEVKGVKYETYTYGFSDDVPEMIMTEVTSTLDSVELDGVPRFEQVDEDPELVFSRLKDDENSEIVLLSGKLLLVTDYYSIEDEISKQDLEVRTLISHDTNREIVELLLSDLSSDINSVIWVTSQDELEQQLRSNTGSIALISPEELTYSVKLLSLDEAYYLDEPTSGYLSASIGVVQKDDDTDFIVSTLSNHFTVEESKSELTEEEILKLRMTGVTAISRNLAITINNSGDPGFAAGLIGDFLADADFTHTSNEVSFVPGCVPEQSLRFCTNIAHYENLKRSGIDIVELTGNHNNDYGSQYNAETVAFYNEEGLLHFGGGDNSEDASKILYIEQDGSKVAMLGYNYFDSVLNSAAIAAADRPGANRYSSEILKKDIATAKENADVVIVDFQFEECYSYPEHGGLYPYCYKPLAAPDQRGVFREAIDFGADIVIGTQAHQPQTYEVYNGKLIFYGLGNIFFDQISWIGTRQGLVLTHYFIDGEHVQTKIDTTLYDRDMRPYLTFGEDREFLLNLLKEAR